MEAVKREERTIRNLSSYLHEPKMQNESNNRNLFLILSANSQLRVKRWPVAGLAHIFNR